MAGFNRSRLAAFARSLRHAPTPSEAALWEALRGKQLGVSFRRQVPLCGFIADFYASSHKLVVEVDGPYHAERARADARRDREFVRRGYRVLRLPAELVLHARPVAVAAVRAALAR
jgi:very-short-patch-repair endonuclease